MLSMSTIEISLQSQKPYNGQKQDHGDAASRKGRGRDFYEEGYGRRAKVKKDAEQLRVALSDAWGDYEAMTSTQLERAADEILNETAIDEPSESIPVSYEDTEEDVIEVNHDDFLTEADLGIRSKREIQKQMARRVTLDPDFDFDDIGDDDYNLPVRIKARL